MRSWASATWRRFRVLVLGSGIVTEKSEAAAAAVGQIAVWRQHCWSDSVAPYAPEDPDRSAYEAYF